MARVLAWSHLEREPLYAPKDVKRYSVSDSASGEHALQVIDTSHWRLVEADDDVSGVHARSCCGRILFYRFDASAAFLGEIEMANDSPGQLYVLCANTEIRAPNATVAN